MKKTLLFSLLFSFLTSNAQVNTLKESVYFSIGKTSITNAHKKKLDSLIKLLKSSKSYSGEIKGYTCNIGSNSINKVISNLRALNVYNYLVDRGIKRNNFTFVGIGTSENEDNSSSESRSQNRRADIEVLLSLMDNISNDYNNETNSSTKSGNYRVIKEYRGYATGSPNSSSTNTSSSNTSTSNNANGESELSFEGTKTGSGSSSNSSSGKESSSASSNSTSTSFSNASSTFRPSVELGPEFVSGKAAIEGNKRIISTNGIVLDIDKNTFVSTSKEPVEIDIKDYTKNADIIKKGINTTVGNKYYKLLGAFTANFTQEYQDLAINSTKPLIVSIPGEFDPEIKLYSNHRNWTLDEVNKLSYNQEKKAYEVAVINNTQMIGLMKPMIDTLFLLAVKIKGVSPDLIKPYIIFDDCTIANGSRLKGKWFVFPITSHVEKYKLRGQVIDYSTKTPTYNHLDFDITDLQPVGGFKQIKGDKGIIYLKYPSKIFMKEGKLMQSSLCEMPTNL